MKEGERKKKGMQADNRPGKREPTYDARDKQNQMHKKRRGSLLYGESVEKEVSERGISKSPHNM